MEICNGLIIQIILHHRVNVLHACIEIKMSKMLK